MFVWVSEQWQAEPSSGDIWIIFASSSIYCCVSQLGVPRSGKILLNITSISLLRDHILIHRFICSDCVSSVLRILPAFQINRCARRKNKRVVKYRYSPQLPEASALFLGTRIIQKLGIFNYYFFESFPRKFRNLTIICIWAQFWT